MQPSGKERSLKMVVFHSSSHSFSDELKNVTEGEKMVSEFWDHDEVKETWLEFFPSHTLIVTK